MYFNGQEPKFQNNIYPEDGNNTFLQNMVPTYQTTWCYPRRPQSQKVLI
jgi:hypothetical protein